jgi:hypothetical protein
MNYISIYRPGSPATIILSPLIDEKTVYRHKLMGEHRIQAQFTLATPWVIQIGDYVTHNSENYYINRIPSVVKINNTTFQYTVDFEAVEYDLKKKLYISTDGLAEFGYTGTALDFVTAIVANMNVNYTGWTVGTVDETDEKTIVFSNQDCYSVLMKVAETFNLEFTVVGKSISMIAAVGSETAFTFTYGKGAGLYKLERQQVSDQNIVTKVYGFGSMQNIPYTYRNRSKRLVFEERFLTKNTELYGVIEGQYTNDDIFPNRTSDVESVNMVFTDGVYQPQTSYISDSSIDFDLNDYLIEGMTPLIVFKSGDLSGQEFEIWKYDHATKRIYFNPQSEEDGYTTPNTLNVPITGDLYTLVNIALPQSYIDAAETALKAATQAYLDENSLPMVVYAVDIDEKYARTNTITVTAGDKVTVVDADLGVDSLIRIAQIEYPLNNIYNIKAVIADFVPYTIQERIIHGTVTQTIDTRIIDRSADELTRRNAMRQRQLKDLIFDSDGYFDGTRIRPLSIETMYLSVGAKSQNFHLNGVTIKANWNGTETDPNALYVSAGELVHHELEITGLGYVWIIGSAATFDDLVSTTAYYLYCKCSKSALTGSWDLSATQKAADGNDGYYYFLCGVLYAVYTDEIGSWRDFDFTYGMTYINGRTITTGRIQSLNKLNYFDLDQNAARLGDSNSSIDWNVTNPDTLTLIGALVQREPGEYFPITVFRGTYSPTTVYHRGDQVNYLDETWIYVNATPASGITPVEGAYWNKLSSIGAAGRDGASPVGIFCGEWSVGKDYYGTSARVDIVYYTVTGRYYIATPTAGNPFRGVLPTNEDYWSDFGGDFESLATNLFFAETAFIENLGVRFFEGVPVGVGDLTGTVTNETANVTGTARIDTLALSGTSGSANITVGGLTKLCTYINSSLNDTAIAFVMEWYQDYYAIGIQLNYSGSSISFREINGNDFSGSSSISTLTGNLSGSFTTDPSHVEGAKRVDRITLSGTGGSANVTCDGLIRRAMWGGSLSETATNFVANHAASYLLGDVVVTADGEDLVFTSRYKGVDFTGSTTIVNVPSSYSGAISIEGNDIWEDKSNSSSHAAILVNMKGYNGGSLYFRQFIIGDGKGNAVLAVGGNSLEDGDGKFVNIDAATVRLSNLPTSGTGLFTGRVYQDANGYLRIKQ